VLATKKKECECCGTKEWRDIFIGLFLVGHHKDGNSANNKLENFEVLCPNCHSTRHTFESSSNPSFEGQQSSYLSPNAVTYNEESEVVKSIKTLLEDPNRPVSLKGCAEQIGISQKMFQSIILKTFPQLWKPDPGSARRLDLEDTEVIKQVAII
jgi:hypothetical protein